MAADSELAPPVAVARDPRMSFAKWPTSRKILCAEVNGGNLTTCRYLSGGTQLHLAIDGYGGDPKKLQDVDLIQDFLDEYPSTIGMTKVVPPQVYTYHGKVPEDWGVSGFVIIAESHISIHTFPDRGYVNIDIFSCKEFDADASLEDVKATFSLPEVKTWTLERGLEYSAPREAYHGMVRERVGLSPFMSVGPEGAERNVQAPAGGATDIEHTAAQRAQD